MFGDRERLRDAAGAEHKKTGACNERAAEQEESRGPHGVLRQFCSGSKLEPDSTYVLITCQALFHYI